jgi:beta-galactosidase
MFAIALLNKPPKKVSDKWNDRLVELTLSTKQYDPTRDFITLDGDRDMEGRLPVWSKHFGHGLKINDLPQNPNKPLIVGECGATYYGLPSQLYPFLGDRAYESYYGRNEALAIDIYQNAVQMARPYLAYFSPSEVCWFGIEHLNLGYHDFSRLPNLKDGIFPMKPYEEGKPGYQFERIPPYTTTFNPGLDTELPLYKPLPMFEALKAALAQPQPMTCTWDSYIEVLPPVSPEFPDPVYQIAFFAGGETGKLAEFIHKNGIRIVSDTQTPNLLIVDAETVSQQQLNAAMPVANRIKKNGGLILVMLLGEQTNPVLNNFLPARIRVTDRRATALEGNPQSVWGKFFHLSNLYFAEQEGDRYILKHGLSGELVEKGTVVFQASRTDWSLFNNVAENRKCAQVVLYEQMKKADGAALITCRLDNATLAVSALDYRLDTKETQVFWKNLFAAMKINTSESIEKSKETKQKQHNLLLDGPVD